jgi:hypothetical protein
MSSIRDAVLVLNRAGKLMWEDFAHTDTAEFFHAVVKGYEPDLTSPKDVGCLAALAREATGDPGGYAAPVEDAGHWEAYAGLHAGLAATEGEAWAAVLIAAAERCKTPAE